MITTARARDVCVCVCVCAYLQLPAFSESYVQKVYVEFAAAVRDMGAAADDELDDLAQTAM